MAIFSKTKENEEEKVSIKTDAKKAASVFAGRRKAQKGLPKSHYSENLSAVLLRPRITEKATYNAENGVYVFEIATDATKRDVIKAVELFYKVTPVKVNLAKIPAKTRMTRRRIKGVKSGGKKAYVFLKKGDSIEIV